jgi:hypothetical protein
MRARARELRNGRRDTREHVALEYALLCLGILRKVGNQGYRSTQNAPPTLVPRQNGYGVLCAGGQFQVF